MHGQWAQRVPMHCRGWVGGRAGARALLAFWRYLDSGVTCILALCMHSGVTWIPALLGFWRYACLYLRAHARALRHIRFFIHMHAI